MQTLHVFGIDHSRTPIGVREGLSFSSDETLQILPSLMSGDPAAGGVSQAMLLSTCNRTEVYLTIEGDTPRHPLEPLCRYRAEAKIMSDQCVPYHYTDRAAAHHLLAVAASLRSEVPGDSQIGRQVAAAASLARRAGTLGHLLEHLAVSAVRSAKRVRRETGLMAGNSGIGQAVLHTLRHSATDAGRARQPLRVLLLGAGDVAEEVALHLGPGSDRPSSAKRDIELVGVWARDKRKAVAFAERFGINRLSGPACKVSFLQVDAVVAACRGRLMVLSERSMESVLARRVAPLVVLDLGVPRNLDPSVAGRDGLQAIFLDQVHQRMRERSRIRATAVAEAERIIEDEVDRFDRWRMQSSLRPIRADLYGTIETVLGRWRSTQPAAVRHLRVAIHRALGSAFAIDRQEYLSAES